MKNRIFNTHQVTGGAAQGLKDQLDVFGGQRGPLSFVHQRPQLHQPLCHQGRPPPQLRAAVAAAAAAVALQERHEFGNVQVDELQFFRHTNQVQALLGYFLVRFNQHFDRKTS